MNRSVNLVLHSVYTIYNRNFLFICAFSGVSSFSFSFLLFLYLSRSSLHPHKTKCMFIYNSNFYLYYSFEQINARKRKLFPLLSCMWMVFEFKYSIYICFYVRIPLALHVSDHKFCFWRLQNRNCKNSWQNERQRKKEHKATNSYSLAFVSVSLSQFSCHFNVFTKQNRGVM